MSDLEGIARTAHNAPPIPRAVLFPRALSALCALGDPGTRAIGFPLPSITADHALFLDCQTLDIELIPFRVSVADSPKVLVIDTRTPRRLAGGEYADRRRACQRAAVARKRRNRSRRNRPRASTTTTATLTTYTSRCAPSPKTMSLVSTNGRSATWQMGIRVLLANPRAIFAEESRPSRLSRGGTPPRAVPSSGLHDPRSLRKRAPSRPAKAR